MMVDTNDIRHDPSINLRATMSQQHKELLWMLRRFNLVKGKGCPNELFNDEVYAELDVYGWVERDDKCVYITNKGLEDVKQAEDTRR